LTEQKKRIRQVVAFTIHPSILVEVDARSDNRSRQIENDLRRYYALMQAVRAEMRLTISKRQQAALMQHLVRDIGVSALAPGLDRPTLEWYDGLGAVQKSAVWDAADRYWYQRGKGLGPEPRLFEEE
jgi:hypothetical protein